MSFEKLVKRVEELTRERDRAEGALEAQQAKLKEMGCKSLAVAKRRVSELRQETSELQQQFDESLQQFEQKWKEVL